MQDTRIKEFPLYSAADLTNRRKSLLEKGSNSNKADVIERRFEFAKAAEAGGDAFLSWFGNLKVDAQYSSLSFRPKNRPLTGQEIANPPIDTEYDNYNIIKELPPRLATGPFFWTSYQLEMVRQSLVDPADLATPIKSINQSGRARLQKAIRRRNLRILDECIRTILRQLGGLPEVRGNVSVFVDCRLSRAWWRGHLSHQIAEDMNLDLEKVWLHLRLPDATWDQLQQYAVKRLTVVGDRNVRSALVARLMESALDQNSSKDRRLRTQAFIAKVGARSAYQALGALTPEQNLSIFREMEV